MGMQVGTHTKLERAIAASLAAADTLRPAEQFAIARDSGAAVIGVNNRDLHSLEISLDVSRELAGNKPAGTIFVAESGLSSRAEIDELKGLGFDAFLIGETLMRSGDPIGKLEELGA